jgi:hypothetical protein
MVHLTVASGLGDLEPAGPEPQTDDARVDARAHLGRAALAYQGRGFSVLPVRQRAKRPLTSHRQPRRQHRASGQPSLVGGFIRLSRGEFSKSPLPAAPAAQFFGTTWQEELLLELRAIEVPGGLIYHPREGDSGADSASLHAAQRGTRPRLRPSSADSPPALQPRGAGRA